MINNRRLLLGGSSELVLTANKSTVSAGADTVTLTTKYGSSDVSTQATYTVSYSGSSSTNQNKVSFTSLGTTATSAQTITIQAKLNGILSNIVTLTRQANTSTTSYSHSISADCDDIPASGGYSDDEISVYYSTTTYYTWTSGSTSSGGTSGNWVDGYTTSQNLHGSDLGTTPKSRTKLGTVTVTYSGYTDTVDVYQAANSIESYYYSLDCSLTYTDIPASGGYAYPSTSVSCDRYATYTSGSSKYVDCTYPSNYSVSYSGTNVNKTNGNAGSAASLETTIKNSHTVYTTAYATFSYNGYNGSDSCTVYQDPNIIEDTVTSGGTITWGDITGTSVSNYTIPARGGSGTATASTAKQSYTTTAGKVTYTYSSGATKTDTSGTSTNGTIDVKPNPASITASADSRGTTTGSQKVIKQQTVTWSSNGKSATGTLYIYQEANSVVSTTKKAGTTAYSELTGCTVTNATIPASGGTGTARASTGHQTITYSGGSLVDTYTSGATATRTDTSDPKTTTTIDVQPDHASISADASNRTTVGGDQITRTYQTVTWSSHGKTHTEVMYVWQQENRIIHENNDISWVIIQNVSGTYRWYGDGLTKDASVIYTSGSSKESILTGALQNAGCRGAWDASGADWPYSFSWGSNYCLVEAIRVPDQKEFGSAELSLNINWSDGSKDVITYIAGEDRWG